MSKDNKNKHVSCDLTTRDRTHQSKLFTLTDTLHFAFKSSRSTRYLQQFQNKHLKP